MIGALFNNSKRKEALGLKTGDDLQQLDALLEEWANQLAAHVELIRKEEVALQERFDTAAESEQADLAAQLKAVKARMETATSSLGLMIGIMKQRNLETSEYSQLLITSTGQITQEIFEKEVAVGLLTDWLAKGKRWIVENGMDLLFEVIVVILILVAFRLLAIVVGKFVARAVNNSRLNISSLLKHFTISTSQKAVMLLGILVALSQMGIDVGPMLAGLGVTLLYIFWFKGWFFLPDTNMAPNNAEHWILGISPEAFGAVGAAVNFIVAGVVYRATAPPAEHIQHLVESVRIPRGAKAVDGSHVH